ncbi:tetratricopeptide repeat protein [Ideonella sp. 4Y16]|uniref:Tetratricopeptide repeat protein n=1 Tax=Ideonella alba TaxID=2824118 RepID=A0A940Y7D1_9BURK|nr:tetratricopeptide repeat protein [Ideonella alba]MBQ0930021.1 tetratricopeptide repeat protein [Ideonella alba]MBQ0946081.1 tetratricopeptide repeat protein [Ideonella alba]
MIDITLQNFEAELITASTRQPVLLDIWAPWCGPCKSLGPTLEKLETEYAGRFTLAKLNSDEQPEIAGQLSQAFGVRSIPFCVMFVGGQPVDGFVGAIPEPQIREFLGKHVPTEDALEAEAEVEEAEAMLAEGGDIDSVIAKLQEAVAIDPSNDVARLDYLKVLLGVARQDPSRIAQARAAFDPVAAKVLSDSRFAAVEHWLKACEAAQQARPPEALAAAVAANKRDFAARFEAAQVLFAVGAFTQAMDELLEIIMRDKAWNDEAARKTYVAILELMTKPAAKPAAGEAPKGALEVTGKAAVAPVDPVLEQYRRKLSMALF